MHVIYYFNILDCPTRITLSSTGGAILYMSKFGRYNLIRYDDSMNAIYGHSLKNGTFLYKAKTGIWFVSQTLDQNSIVLIMHLL